ncbi:hypothetical protein DPEC_G00310120 [Dallia pectoralis]|uniref:Uncharacterized protein n=1 Tax=Dallia pectoralis TaxID=75939 RepID=A0ACC2FF28_DALPE|nr:hypothetical protein DPEC_G00310120 [Dallia pectoralis]
MPRRRRASTSRPVRRRRRANVKVSRRRRRGGRRRLCNNNITGYWIANTSVVNKLALLLLLGGERYSCTTASCRFRTLDFVSALPTELD